LFVGPYLLVFDKRNSLWARFCQLLQMLQAAFLPGELSKDPMQIVGGSFADSGSSPARNTPLFAVVRTFLRSKSSGSCWPIRRCATVAGLRIGRAIAPWRGPQMDRLERYRSNSPGIRPSAMLPRPIGLPGATSTSSPSAIANSNSLAKTEKLNDNP
jgi:hypothetical protein